MIIGAVVSVLLATVCVTSVAVVTPSSAEAASPGDATILLSASEGGGPGDQASISPDVSADGRYVVFSSGARNLAGMSPTNGFNQIYILDRDTGSLERISNDRDGEPGNSWSYYPQVSDDGRFVAYQTTAGNLPGYNYADRVLLYDRVSTTTTVINEAALGVWNTSQNPNLSGDGRYIAYYGVHNNSSNASGIHVWDRVSGATRTVPHTYQGRDLGYGVEAGAQIAPAMSENGRFLAFSAHWSHLVAGRNTLTLDVFLWDSVTNDITWVSTHPDGSPSQDGESSTRPAISGDGRYIAYMAPVRALGLSTETRNGIVWFDRLTGERRAIANPTDGSGLNDNLQNPAMSRDGRTVSFEEPSASSGDRQIYSWNVDTNETELVSRSAQTGLPGDSQSHFPHISGDGSVIVYFSMAGDLVSPPIPRVGDYSDQVFLYDASMASPPDVTAPNVTAVRSPSPNAAGWNNAPVDITWDVSDPDDPPEALTAPPAVTVASEGADQIIESGPVCDPAGNCARGNTTVSIDLTKPELAGQIVNGDGSSRLPNEAGWYGSAVRVHWTCADALSGVAVCPADGYLAVEGADQSVQGSVSDLAGNETMRSVGDINIDSVAPSSSAENACGTNSYCTGSAVSVLLSATDAGSGVKEMHAQIGDGPVQVLDGASATVSVDLEQASGTKVVRFWAVDFAGNSEPPNAATVKFDNVAPVITHTATPAPNAAGWNRSDVTIRWNATDEAGGSGVAFVSPDVLVDTETPGTSFIGRAIDSAGNSATDSVRIKLDETSPTIAATLTGSKNSAGSYIGAVTVSFTCADEGGSGLVSCPSTAVLTQAGDSQSISGVASDAAGNTSEVTISGISIASPPPGVTISPIPGGGPNNHLAGGSPLTGQATSAGQLISVVGTFTPQGAGRDPVGVVGTLTPTSSVDGLTTYSWSVTPPSTLHGRMTFVATLTDNFGQSTASSPITIVVS